MDRKCTPVTKETRARFTLVDGLRGLAAVSVVLYHAVEGNHITALYSAMPETMRALLENGNSGVAIFFVLSGFVIAHSLDGQTLTGWSAGRFMAKRSVRLDPPYWVAIGMTMLFSTLAAAVVKGRPIEEYSLPQIVAHVFYLQDLLGFQNINPVFWTLCFEVQFYLVFALLLLTRSSKMMLAAFVMSLLWPLRICPEYHGLFTSLWYGFLLGVGAYFSWKKTRLVPWFLAYTAVIVGAGAYRRDVFMIVCAATSLILLISALSNKLTTFLNWRWLQFLGTISYSLYLVHNPITGASFRVGYLLTNRTALTEAIWWMTSTLACVLTATIVWAVIEKPSMKLSKILTRSRKQQQSVV
jgi:peptidoglycan/LPS O-acetylase OafA/YrhL